MSTTKTQGSFDSNGVTVFYTKWASDAPRGVVQLAHGMAEHIERYDDFARFLCDHGFSVYGDDHRGHGRTGRQQGTLGKLADRDGWKLVVDDMKALTDLIRSENPAIPVILLGHSMGSFLARHYASQYGDGIDGLIVMGTSGRNPASGAGIMLVNLLARLKGEDHRSMRVNAMAFGSYNKRFDKRTVFDWLSADHGNVDRYAADELCGFCFTLSGFRDLFSVLSAVSQDTAFAAVPKDLPILVVSGADDPVGSYGAGVREVFERFRAAQVANVSIKLYPGMRHEILNETDHQTVYDDLARWCGEIVSQQQ